MLSEINKAVFITIISTIDRSIFILISWEIPQSSFFSSISNTERFFRPPSYLHIARHTTRHRLHPMKVYSYQRQDLDYSVCIEELYTHILQLTLSLALISAPRSTRYWATDKCPAAHAPMRAVFPSCITRYNMVMNLSVISACVTYQTVATRYR